jgi:hypothetical protein
VRHLRAFRRCQLSRRMGHCKTQAMKNICHG